MKKWLILLCIINFNIGYAQVSVQPFLADIIIQFPGVRDLAISPSGNELFFTLQSHKEELSSIVYLHKENGMWAKPAIANFSGKYNDLEPAFSPDGLRLYFASNRPLKGNGEAKDYDIWYLERKDVQSNWSGPINVGEPVNTSGNEFYPSIAHSNNLYFTSDGPGSFGKDDIFISKWVKGRYEKPQTLSDSINTKGYEFNAYVAPDESFLLYTGYNYLGGLGSGDIYICYNRNGIWSAPQNLGKDINSVQMDYCPFVDMKTGMLYFTSKRNNLQTKFEQTQTLESLLKEMNKYDNGASRLYCVDISKWLK